MLGLIRKMALVGLGVIALAQEEVKKLLKEWVKRYKAPRKKVKKGVERLVKQGETCQKRIVKGLAQKVQFIVGKVAK